MVKAAVTGIILAGGKSSRMGRDKGLCRFHGKSLVSYAIETLKPLCGRIIISANNEIEDYASFGLEVLPDDVTGIGPMGGIFTCLRQSDTRHNLVLSCDTPFVTTRLFEFLLENIDKYQVLVPGHGDDLLEPLAACYATNVLAVLGQCVESGDYKMMNFFKKVNFHSLAVDELLPSFSGKLFQNLNTPDDLIKC
ncbi:MAG: molybdenum cofactor guanylyltransferase [Bacteroidales bacterium]|nr:molybdenum cofactor guanylyltransferase [Bacteroidales bacterium]MCF6341350.1 molybdenum cofactor guanylyltransferase [Bacteroidales bacterium]